MGDIMIKNKLGLVPTEPGCYLMMDDNKNVIYVGKAKNLKKRLSSYFSRTHTGKTKVLIDNVKTFEYIVTTNETEALILELNLIKKYNPKYNILMRDDKTYPYIELTVDKYPRLSVVRKNITKRDKTKLFGPYPNVYAARKTVNMLNRMYPLRKCKTFSKKECLYYYIKECAGYCARDIDFHIINNMKMEIIKFLKGNDDIVIDRIKTTMDDASSKLNYEKANEMKLLLNDIETTLNKQRIDLNDYIDRDVFGYCVKEGYISIQVFHLRGGRLVERGSTIYPLIDNDASALTSYIYSFYDKNNIKPKQILVPAIINTSLMNEALNIEVINPKKGPKKQLLDMAINNASIALEEKIKVLKKEEEMGNVAYHQLEKLLNIKKINRIEIFDNSNLFGTFSVSGMVVYIDGKPVKNEYRKYKITTDHVDDYNIMKEVIYRRYFRVLKDKLQLPDLIIVDGGKGQIKAATEVLLSLKLNIPVCGLKKDEKHKTNELLMDSRVILIDKKSYLFNLLARMQAEVHRFTISYHKDIRSKGAIESILDNVKGIGEVRKNKLLRTFDSFANIKETSIDDLAKIIPLKVAVALKKNINKGERDKK